MFLPKSMEVRQTNIKPKTHRLEKQIKWRKMGRAWELRWLSILIQPVCILKACSPKEATLKDQGSQFPEWRSTRVKKLKIGQGNMTLTTSTFFQEATFSTLKAITLTKKDLTNWAATMIKKQDSMLLDLTRIYKCRKIRVFTRVTIIAQIKRTMEASITGCRRQQT